MMFIIFLHAWCVLYKQPQIGEIQTRDDFSAKQQIFLILSSNAFLIIEAAYEKINKDHFKEILARSLWCLLFTLENSSFTFSFSLSLTLSHSIIFTHKFDDGAASKEIIRINFLCVYDHFTMKSKVHWRVMWLLCINN